MAMRWIRGAGVVIAASVFGCRPTTTNGSDAAPAVSVAPVVAPKATGAKVPPEPSAPLSAKAGEATTIENELAADTAYQGVWDPKRMSDRLLFLTTISDGLVGQNSENGDTSFVESATKALERAKLGKALMNVIGFAARTGKLPKDFATNVDAHLKSVAGEDRRGLWAPRKGNEPPRDIAALACVLHPENAEYLREFIASRRAGPYKWANMKSPLRPYLVREKAAFERLATLTGLTSAEEARFAELKASKLGDDPPDEIELADLLKEYGSNEVRADDKFKMKVIDFTGVAGALERGALAGITLPIGTGKAFERPQVHCFFDDVQTPKVKELNKGDRVHVRGRVKGLMANVIVEHCELVD